MFRSKLTSLLQPLGLFFLTFFIYLHNLSASVYGGDSGDFLSAIATKGVPHPSGYPLYTMLGIIFSSFPIHQSLAWKVDLISALFSSLTVVLMYCIVKELTKNKLLAIINSLTLAFLFPFWLFAEVSEVFALHHFFLLLLFFLSLLFYSTQRLRYLYLLALTTGLSFTNHELTLLILPSLFLFAVHARKKISLPVFIRCIELFFLGLLPYLYIPLAAAHNPPIDWDHATNLKSFLSLVTRSGYGWVGGGTNIISTGSRLSLQNYILYWFGQLPFPVLICILLGMIAMLKQKRWTIFLATISAYLLFGPFFFLYSSYITLTAIRAGIDEKFYTSSMLFLLLFLPYGIRYLVDLILHLLSPISPLFLKRRMYPVFFTSLFLLCPFFLFVRNNKITDLHTISIGDRLGKDTLSSLPRSSSVWITEDDNITFTSRYIQYAFGLRQDVHMLAGLDLTNTHVDTTLHFYTFPYWTRSNAPIWYGLYLSKSKPTLMMLPNYNELNQIGKTKLYPYGLLLKITTTQEQTLTEQLFLKRQQSILDNFTYSGIPQSSQLSHLSLIQDIPLLYANAYANTGIYLIAHYKDYDRAKPYFEKALEFSQDSDSAYEGLGDYFFYKHACQKARDAYETATEINPLDLTAYHKLYGVVTTCSPDSGEANKLRSLASRYPKIFEGVIPFLPSGQ